MHHLMMATTKYDNWSKFSQTSRAKRARFEASSVEPLCCRFQKRHFQISAKKFPLHFKRSNARVTCCFGIGFAAHKKLICKVALEILTIGIGVALTDSMNQRKFHFHKACLA
jgi:hypothetical protein